ncbi:MAG: hypothetical protein A2021_07610 [Elusimicrobia bacterium GWF2_52_66]|nr:MAG: hypothetical protein A2X33_00140 [Elusimicrobia bacterium GWA2_51_34]OGR86952.1 MAG: hypothetical protein A2021_07610 [Elusimicrobia bacterium GWF2_52_66]HAF94435.1 hypothetical protein [Elusimicrobiota bacterium]HCE98934.1 hypothetical protein [Elusimicrobiota bacterium]
MVNKKIWFFAALALGQFFTLNASAQNLYVSNMDVRSKGVGANAPGSTGFCNDVRGDSSASEGSVAFLTASGNVWKDSSLIEFERPRTQYPGACLGLCVQLVCISTSGAEGFGIDELTYEIFKFKEGTNPLDPSSSPPIKTISMYNIGQCKSTGNSLYTIVNPITNLPWFCAAWDGSYNLRGMFGKSNGQFGFRAHVKTNQVSPTAGNISIEQTSAYPGMNQIPIQINVTNIHDVRSSPTVVGKVTGVAAQPYNILYRLSKDATTTINIYDADAAHLIGGSVMPLVRSVISSAPRVGEGIPDGTLTNGDFWDGRDSHGDIVPSGNFLAQITAASNDLWRRDDSEGADHAWPQTVQIGLDPLQITDVGSKPLGPSSTELAVISYILTEAATVYVDIYTPGTSFDNTNISPPSAPIGGTLVRRYIEVKERRVTAVTAWDGRDSQGNIVCDGDYVYAIYASLPSGADYVPGGLIWTRSTRVGTATVMRGRVVPFVENTSTLIGSSPTVMNLDPFYFRYTPKRDTLVTLNILDAGNNSVRTLISSATRTNISVREMWDGRGDDGKYVPGGIYQAQLITNDQLQCAWNRISTVTTMGFSVDMFRITDVKVSPLLSGSTDIAMIEYKLSQSLYTDFSVYDTNVVVNPSSWPWTGAQSPGVPVYRMTGMGPGRYRITQPWEGRDKDGQLLPDGSYPFTLVAYTTGTTQTIYAVDKVYGAINIARGQIAFLQFEVIPNIPTMYNSSDVVKLPPYEISYVLTRQSSVTVQVLAYDQSAQGRVVANVISGQTRDANMVYKDFWDGKTDLGSFVPGGQYDVRVTAQDISRKLTGRTTAQQTIDVYPMRIYDVAITPLTLDQPAVISYQISEPMKVVTKVFYPGTSFDSSGKAHPLEPGSVVKRIIGVRPPRTQISEYWDGTDLTLSKAPDGNYVFKLYASTNSDAISTLDGDLSATLCPGNSCLADDVVTANIPLTSGGTADLCGDFSGGSFFAPNPYEGKAGWFHIPVIINGRITLKIYNLAGDLVYKHDFGEKGAGDDPKGIVYLWPKVNSYGKTVAGGVYFAVIRFEASSGTRDVCQVVKKILIP